MMLVKRPVPPPANLVNVIDERWMREWVDFGMAELARYLARHAAFDAYYHQRNHQKEH